MALKLFHTYAVKVDHIVTADCRTTATMIIEKGSLIDSIFCMMDDGAILSVKDIS